LPESLLVAIQADNVKLAAMTAAKYFFFIIVPFIFIAVFYVTLRIFSLNF
jgi:hypothetical protein